MLAWRFPVYLACLRRPIMHRAICRLQAAMRMWSTRRKWKASMDLHHVQWEMRRLNDGLAAQMLVRTTFLVTRVQAAIRGYLHRKRQQRGLERESTLAAGTLQLAEGELPESSAADTLTRALPTNRRSSLVARSLSP